MNISIDKTHVMCHVCLEHKRIGVDTYMELNIDDGLHDRILCLRCDAMLGFRKDVSWLNNTLQGGNDEISDITTS